MGCDEISFCKIKVGEIYSEIVEMNEKYSIDSINVERRCKFSNY